MRALFLVILAGLAGPAIAAPSDDQARRLIVGDWIADPGLAQTAHDPLYRALARYNSDGTGQVQVFHDAACRKLAMTRDFRWRIESGVVMTVADQGATRDEIVSLDNQSMTLRLAGRLEHRVRAATCSRQMAV
jgi:hypothetical protein